MGQIELCSICKKYGERKIFDHFSLNIEQGEFLGIKGNSGKGKTTLLNIIGLLESCEGEIRLDGTPVSSEDYRQVRKLLKKRIGYLFQNFALVDDLTVQDNLKIVMEREPKEQLRQKMESALLKVGLDKEFLDKKIFTLSGGEQQRIAIARLMLKECDIILADEPTGSLDETNGKLIIELLRNMNEEGKTMIMVSHDPDAFLYCSRIIEL
ncbi:MAG: ATP-binding cassette domain-containing protein [Lachnospiraceae bacterium]|nr:ATP-binding cassette domain-containing protein [Lachnospiraceae bacterium]